MQHYRNVNCGLTPPGTAPVTKKGDRPHFMPEFIAYERFLDEPQFKDLLHLEQNSYGYGKGIFWGLTFVVVHKMLTFLVSNFYSVV